MDRRKVIARKRNGQIIKGYIESIPEFSGESNIIVTSLTEQTLVIPKSEMKALFFVKRFSGNKEYSEIKVFDSQPRIDGLWVRLTFYDMETIEGIVPNSTQFLADDGFYLRPPDSNSNNRMVYVVKSALKDFTVLGVQYSKGDISTYYEKFMSAKNSGKIRG
ncbi:MAG: hypothetical protein L0387_24760 [Acidobacteria bacterium]|nr:hypothetical protein [Acidobacteriota bacterium]MCI0719100.1 hypothetical protein [Acidobacteriota bacterium]